jgi:hypothetical protein
MVSAPETLFSSMSATEITNAAVQYAGPQAEVRLRLAAGTYPGDIEDVDLGSDSEDAKEEIPAVPSQVPS